MNERGRLYTFCTLGSAEGGLMRAFRLSFYSALSHEWIGASGFVLVVRAW